MVQEIRENVIIQAGGLIEIRRPDLPEGTPAEVVVTFRAPDAVPPLTSLLGKARSGYASGEDADAFVRRERDAWEH